jgi:hypothetical protein
MAILRDKSLHFWELVVLTVLVTYVIYMIATY